MSKMLLTLPAVMLLSKLDYEDPTILTLARVSFVAMMAIKWLTHKLAVSKIQAADNTEVIYVPVATPSMLGPAEPKATDPRKKTTYREHEEAQAAQVVQQTMVTTGLMLFLTFKMGMHMPLLLQVVMGGFEMFTSPIIKKHVLGMNVDRPWMELKEGEEGAVESATPDAKPEDAAAAAASASSGGAASGGAMDSQMREAIAHAWDGKEAFTADAFEALHKRGADMNVQTTDDKWTILMVAAGTRGVQTPTFAKLIEMGARRDVTDSDGWTPLHWCAFHGNSVAVTAVLDGATPQEQKMVLNMRCLSGETALEVATKELESAKEKLNEEKKNRTSGESKAAHWEAVAERQQETVNLLKQADEDADAMVAADEEMDGTAEAESKGDEGTVRRRPAASGSEEIQELD